MSGLEDSIDYDNLDNASKASDTSDLNIADAMPVSEEILASLSSSDTEIDSTQLTKAESVLAQFEELEKAQTEHIARRTSESLFTSVESSEEYFKSVAALLYTEMHKAARVYVKNWCALNDYTQKWTNPFSATFSAKRLTHLSPFIPKVYTLSIVHKRSLKPQPSDTQVLCDMMPTAREATITGAKRLGFDNSMERKLVFTKFSPIAVNKIINDPRYLNEQRQLHIFEEHRKQIEARSFVPASLRDKWFREIEQKSALSGGLI